MPTSDYTSEPEIPYGYCHCGCGQKTSINKHDNGQSPKGTPQRFCIGHRPYRSAYVRFWNKVHITADDEKCWEWYGYKDKDGYGEFQLERGNRESQIKTHRFSWILANGEIPNKLWVLHSCDNPSCVNPKHLFLGTFQDNIDDKIAKGRQVKGETHPQSKLTRGQVDDIRKLYASGDFTHEKLAIMFNVTQSNITNIINWKTWK